MAKPIEWFRLSALPAGFDATASRSPSTRSVSFFVQISGELVAPGTTGARWNDYLSVGNVKAFGAALAPVGDQPAQRVGRNSVAYCAAFFNLSRQGVLRLR